MARSYQDFQPAWNRVEEDKSETINLQLPGFRKEQLKANIDNRNLKISGERPIEGIKWSRFRKDFRIPDHCNTSEIRATFANGTLTVIMPRTITTRPTQPNPPQKPPQPDKDQSPTQQKQTTSKPAMTGNISTTSPTTQRMMSEKKEEKSDAAEKMTPNSNKSFGMMGKEESPKTTTTTTTPTPPSVQNNKQKPPQPNKDQNLTHVGAAETASHVQEERKWYGREGGLKMMLEGLQKHKPSKLVVNVVVGVMVAVALGVGAYVAYKHKSTETNGV